MRQTKQNSLPRKRRWIAIIGDAEQKQWHEHERHVTAPRKRASPVMGSASATGPRPGARFRPHRHEELHILSKIERSGGEGLLSTWS